MKKILTIIFLLVFDVTIADDKVISSLQNGGKIIFIRHALAPGGGDPENFKISDCSTQRNLNAEGIEQAKKIGDFFKVNNIAIDQVLSSEWCRCKETAKNAFEKYETFDALNSFFSSKFVKNRDKQIMHLKTFIKNWNSKKNIVFVTHYVVILETLDVAVSSGEIIVADKNYKVIGTIEIN